MRIGNNNPDDFRLSCIGCGIDSDLTLTAFRNSLGKVTGWLVACIDCQRSLTNDCEIIFRKKEVTWKNKKR